MSKQFNLYIDEEIQEMAREQAESIGLKVSDYTAMLYKLDLSEMVRKAVEIRNKKVIEKEKKDVK